MANNLEKRGIIMSNKIQIKSMVLQNFKCCKEATYALDGKNVTVCGANGSGKTTIFDSRME